jgi:hypothetical protein
MTDLAARIAALPMKVPSLEPYLHQRVGTELYPFSESPVPIVAVETADAAIAELVGAIEELVKERDDARSRPPDSLRCEGCGCVQGPPWHSWMRTGDDCDLCPACAGKFKAEQAMDPAPSTAGDETFDERLLDRDGRLKEPS